MYFHFQVQDRVWNGYRSHRSEGPPPDLGRRHVRRQIAHHGMLRQNPPLERSGDPGLTTLTQFRFV